MICDINIITVNRFKIVFIQGNLCKTKHPLIQSSDYTGFCLFKVQFRLRYVKPVLRGYLWDKEKVMGQEKGDHMDKFDCIYK